MAGDQLQIEEQKENVYAIVMDLSDTDLVINYCLQNKVDKMAVDELLKRGYTSLKALQLIEAEDLSGPKIPRGQRRTIFHITGALKETASSSMGSNDGTATKNTEDNQLPAEDQPATTSGTTTFGTTTSSTTSSTSSPPTTTMMTAAEVPRVNTTANGVYSAPRNDNADVYHSAIVINLIAQQNALQGLSTVQNSGSVGALASPLQPQVSWNDPQVHISSAGKSASVTYLDICDFVQSNVEEEVVLGNQGDQQVIKKAQVREFDI